MVVEDYTLMVLFLALRCYQGAGKDCPKGQGSQALSKQVPESTLLDGAAKDIKNGW
jgi:hypothetical protein